MSLPLSLILDFDVFGPIIVTEGKTTRKLSSEIKVWGLLFICLVSRAVHIEPLPGLDTVTFKNALRRFFQHSQGLPPPPQ